MEVGGRPLIEWSLGACREAASIETIVVAVPPGEEDRVIALGVEAVPGGSVRADSVAAGLERVETELVVIHDAARPFVTAALVDELVAELASTPGADGVIAAAPVTDTIKEARDGRILHTLDRSKLWGAQTPQVFRTAKLREAIDLDSEATDEAMLIEAAGGTVLLRETTGPNFKVTTADDLRLAEVLLGG
ncbi:MAG: 2-C-methyl-D-erythritol 4-phosphate cytidylyltransferase [Solirubrobacterales bacterium]|nr:2-C-methyl-D-erythritol 4-phosphate cytidylyltransferase [Solirubrobacterales bacterium]